MCRPQAAEQGHRELCALLLQHSPALAAIRDAKGRRPHDVADAAVRDLLDNWDQESQSHRATGHTVPPDPVSNG